MTDDKDDVIQKYKEELTQEYNQFSAKITNKAGLPMYEWILMAQYACIGTENLIRAIKDSYRLGFMDGKADAKDKVLAHFNREYKTED